ncbi:transporter [Rhodoblastus acidophilus]|jgi:molybdopterin-binding protein|uniref:Transporter n=1 Tax=Rhodoblastus acidophilus TaxID=1074 RepID=A0A6N8DM45_RHOAC|nr:TOBE domain-containing protein [Rhodoblastus acidophilus]MCW2274698.1 molybdopterin-binding protein [Rhodoblastus acidophilus]MTV31652.1 transporter [Rhodoblastus acidophilus]
MKISARNVLAGKIVDIKKGATTSHVQIDVNGKIITSAITNEAVEELGLKVGGEASAVIKSSDVMVMVS